MLVYNKCKYLSKHSTITPHQFLHGVLTRDEESLLFEYYSLTEFYRPLVAFPRRSDAAGQVEFL